MFEYPRLERADAKLVFPAYTGMEERLLQDVRTVSVVEGTSVTLRCKLNKPVAGAILTDLAKENPQPPIAGADRRPDDLRGDAALYRDTEVPARSRRLLRAEERQAGRVPDQRQPEPPADDQAPLPGRDMELSAIEELDVRATIVDDFGLPKAGVSYSLAGRDPVDVTLIENGRRDKREIASQIRLEELDAKPDGAPFLLLVGGGHRPGRPGSAGR